MTAITGTPQRLYLMQLSTASVPLGEGRFMLNVLDPSVTNENCGTCRECVDVCPAVALDHRASA